MTREEMIWCDGRMLNTIDHMIREMAAIDYTQPDCVTRPLLIKVVEAHKAALQMVINCIVEEKIEAYIHQEALLAKAFADPPGRQA